MPESDQWNGDDELPKQTVGRAQDAIRDVLGEQYQPADEPVEDDSEDDELKKSAAKRK